jgi:RNA recognition motif-containing protein
MAGALREDELKIFVGSLGADVNKPMLQSLLEGYSLQPVDIHVPEVKPNKLAIAFVTFRSSQEAHAAVDRLHGLIAPAFSPGAIKAHRGDPWGESLSAVIGKLFLAFV